MIDIIYYLLIFGFGCWVIFTKIEIKININGCKSEGSPRIVIFLIKSSVLYLIALSGVKLIKILELL